MILDLDREVISEEVPVNWGLKDKKEWASGLEKEHFSN